MSGMKIRIVMDSSGPGSIPRGTVLEVGKDISKADAMNLLEVRGGHSTPFAVPVVEEEDRTEKAEPRQERVETREEPELKVEMATSEGTSNATASEVRVTGSEDDKDEEPRRGPGRPPGSKNKPKPE